MILAHAEADDADGDGISGRPHRLGDGRVGRFGWRADRADLVDVVREELSVQVGLTLPADLGSAFGSTADDDEVPDPELEPGTMADGTPVRLYSDLLLHDVFEEGALGVGAGDASGRELRTPPLWGIAGSGPYMHDGRSATIEGAIARHAAEAAASSLAFGALDESERVALLTFESI